MDNIQKRLLFNIIYLYLITDSFSPHFSQTLLIIPLSAMIAY